MIAYKITGSPPLLGKRLVLDKSSPLDKETAALLAKISTGNEIYFKPVRTKELEKVNVQTPPGQSNVLGATPASASSPGPTVGSAESSTSKVQGESASATTPVARIVQVIGPGELAHQALHLIEFSRTATHAEVVEYARYVGASPHLASQVADQTMKGLQSHATSALLIGTVVGGATTAATGLLFPKITIEKRLAIGAAVGLIAGILFYTLTSPPNPFAGKWVLSPAESHYEVGDPPQAATCTISEENGGLTFTEDIMLSNGKTEHLRYRLDLDGKEHPASNGTNAETVATTWTNNTLEMIYRRKGAIARRETRALSMDRKQMTVTIAHQTASGSELKNVSMYEKK